MYEWTEERLEALSTPELKNLLGNAERKSADDLAAKCKAVLETRNALKPNRIAKPRTELKNSSTPSPIRLPPSARNWRRNTICPRRRRSALR
jgi:hypothetical protein